MRLAVRLTPHSKTTTTTGCSTLLRGVVHGLAGAPRLGDLVVAVDLSKSSFLPCDSFQTSFLQLLSLFLAKYDDILAILKFGFPLA